MFAPLYDHKPEIVGKGKGFERAASHSVEKLRPRRGFERARLHRLLEKRSIRIRASLQRCRNRRKINSAFRRCALRYGFFSSPFSRAESTL